MNILIFDKHSFTQELVNFGKSFEAFFVVSSQTPSAGTCPSPQQCAGRQSQLLWFISFLKDNLQSSFVREIE